MAELLLSEAEKTYILHGVEDNLRLDGRGRLDYRPMEIETDVAPHANGSARLRLANTDVLVGVKSVIDTPDPDRPNEGKIEFFVDCSANATPEFEGRGGENLANELTWSLDRAYQSASVFNLKTLCILPYHQCWKLYVDILILECGGNLFDAVSLAVKAALFSTKVPRIASVSLDGGQPDLQITDDPTDCQTLDVSGAPCLITLCKVGNLCVVDPAAEEESCCSSSLVVAITEKGQLTASVKTGQGSFHPESLAEALQMAVTVGKTLNKALMERLKEEADLGLKRPISGFLH